MTRGLPVAAALALVAAVCGTAAIALADSFTPVRLTTSIAATARLDRALPITVTVSADPGVLDTRTAPLRIEVKLAPECGGAYEYTPGVVLLNKQLNPQPATGQAYTATARGSGKPNAYGEQTVCVWLAQGGADDEVFASDQSIQVDVSKTCTVAAARYDTAESALRRAVRKNRGVKRARGTAAAAHRSAVRACGAGVAL